MKKRVDFMIKKIQLPLQTLNLVVGFMVWVLISSLLPFIREDIAIAPEQVAIVTAVPVVLGSILRIPLGYYANVWGARLTFFISFIVLLVPVYYLSIASSLTDLIIEGTFLGISGAVFSVGVMSLPRYYLKEKPGLVDRTYVMVTIVRASTSVVAPVLSGKFVCTITLHFYLGLLLPFIPLNYYFGDLQEERQKSPIMEQIKGVYKNDKLWFFSFI